MLQAWSISRRIGVGFLLLNLVVLGLAVFSQRSVSHLGQGYDEYRNISAQSVAAAAYMEDMLKAQVAAFRYHVSPNTADAQAVTSNLAEIIQDTALMRAFDSSPTRAAVVTDIQRQTAEYQSSFQDMSRQMAGATDIRDTFDQVTDALQTQINDIFTQTTQVGSPAAISAAGRSLQTLLNGIVSSKQYFSTADPDDLAATLDLMTQFERAIRQLDALNQQDQIAAKIVVLQETYVGYPDLLTRYDAAFSTASAIKVDQLETMGPAITETLDELVDEIVQRQEALGATGQSIVRDLVNGIPIIGGLAIVLSSISAIWIGRSITLSVRQLADATDALASGKHDVTLVESDAAHELGRMARALKVFQQAQVDKAAASQERAQQRAQQDKVVSEMKSRLAALADGTLTSNITVAFTPEYEDLRTNYNQAIQSLDGAITDVATTAERIDEITEATNAATNDLSQRTENQAATLEQTAAALDELTASVRSAAEHARSVDASVGKARSEATQNGEVVKQAVAAMSEIEHSSQQISQVIGVIDDIAFQTNLLALNAGVEAARAGDSGKGFAVVASEVRALAQRSSEAAKQISSLIANSSRHVSQGTELVGNAGNALSEIITQVNEIADMTGQIASSAEEQAIGLSEINIGVNQLDQVTQQNAAMVQDSLTRGETLAQETHRLADLIARFEVSASNVANQTLTPLKAPKTDEGAANRLKSPTAPPKRAATGTDDAALWEDF